MDLLTRLIAKTSGTLDDDACWLWQGARKEGYGIIKVDGRKRRVHHVGWEQLRGPLPTGLVADHICHEPPCPGGLVCEHRRCWNPKHIEWVTIAVNSARSARAWKTHCAHGHAFTPENTRHARKPDGGTQRVCRECDRLRYTPVGFDELEQFRI